MKDKMKLNFSQFQNTEDALSVSLNIAGKNHLKYIIDTFANFDLDINDEAAIAALSTNDAGFQNDGILYLELSETETKNGQPHDYELDFDEHFTCVKFEF